MPTEEERYRIGEPRYEAPGVQKELAAKVAEMERRQREVYEAPLRARIAELEGKLAEAEAGAAEAWSVIAWLARQDTFGRGEEYVQVARRAERSKTPSAQALTRLVEAALHLSRQRRAGLEHTAVFGDIKMADLEILDYYVDAYLAARTGRGEGEGR